jgi:hypothetical protein
MMVKKKFDAGEAEVFAGLKLIKLANNDDREAHWGKLCENVHLSQST